MRKRVLLVLIVMVLGAPVLSFGAALWTGDWGGLWLNWLTAVGGAAMTYYLFERVIGHMEKLKAEKEKLEAKKANLIAQMRSTRPDVAIPAAEELARHDWLYDGSLQGASLWGANLQGASLTGANLQRVRLIEANLQGANLDLANLQGASLVGANLQGASLFYANLQGANLFYADLQRTDLLKANLQGAVLLGANLQGAWLVKDDPQFATLFDENTILQMAPVGHRTPIWPASQTLSVLNSGPMMNIFNNCCWTERRKRHDSKALIRC